MAVWLGHAGPPGPTGPAGPNGPMGPSGDYLCYVDGGVAPLFNGSNGYVVGPNSWISGDNTVSVLIWFRTANAGQQGFFDAGTDGNNEEAFSLSLTQPGGVGGSPPVNNPGIYWSNWSNDVYIPKFLADDAWHLAIVSLSGKTVLLSIDGQLPGGYIWNGGSWSSWQTQPFTLSNTPNIAGQPLWIGQTRSQCWGTGSVWFSGPLAHVAIVTAALTPSQAAQLYSDGFNMLPGSYQAAVQALNPVLYYPLQETSGTTATNVGTSGSANNGTYEGGVTLAQTPGLPLGLPVLVTSPPAASTVTLTSGTAWQNTTGADVWLYVPVTFSPTASAAASVALGVGATATPSTSTVAAEPAGTVSGAVHTVTAYVPANFYALLTTTNATLGTATVQPA